MFDKIFITTMKPSWMLVDYFIYKSLIFQHEVSRMENLLDN